LAKQVTGGDPSRNSPAAHAVDQDGHGAQPRAAEHRSDGRRRPDVARGQQRREVGEPLFDRGEPMAGVERAR
jgi:hypothetical protein